MSTQRPTSPRFWRLAPVLVMVLGLGALLWSCESEQVGYEVAIPLIGPMEFNETSCEVSGDICSTNDDCFDEDGFDVGPCTKTMKPFEPLRYDVSLTPSTPSFTFPALADTRPWVSLLAALQDTDENPIALATQNFSVTGGPVTLSVRPFSRNGLYFGRDAGYEPVAPSSGSCTFTLDDSSMGEDYSNGISTCLRDWVKENGAPLEFDMEVTSSAGGAPASAALKSGFGPKQQPPNYMLRATDEWNPTDEECEFQIETEALLDATGEGSEFFDFLACKNLVLSGEGMCDQPITLYGVATVYDPCGNHSTGSLGRSIKEKVSIEANRPYTITVYPTQDTIVEQGNDVPVVFPDTAEAFIDLLFTAGAGRCLENEKPPLPDPITGEEPKGYALVNWQHCYVGGDDPIPVRDGDIVFNATGFCPVADSGGAGATGGSGQ